MIQGVDMPSRPLVLYPDPALRQAAFPVEAFDAELESLALDVRHSLEAVSAIGLTASHIGVPKRVVVIRMATDQPVRTLVNPTIAWASGDLAAFEEGSVSMPGIRETVERPARIRIAYRALDGSARSEDAEGFEAAVIQHEIDQLDGVFWIDRLSRLKRDRLTKRYDKLRRAQR